VCPNSPVIFKAFGGSYLAMITGLVELDNPSILESQSTASHNALPTHAHFPKLQPCCFMSADHPTLDLFLHEITSVILQ
jgi:hypothetical protein